jgi:hypothetical protein
MQHIVIDPRGALPTAAQAFVVPDSREAIELAVEALIARLDEADGDPDLEPNGDECDGTNAEDEFLGGHAGGWWDGPGCPISDPGGCEHDGSEPDEDF